MVDVKNAKFLGEDKNIVQAKKAEAKVEAPKGKKAAAKVEKEPTAPRASKLAGMKIKVLNKVHGAREGTKRAAWMEALISSKTVGEAQSKVENLTSDVVRFAEASGFISLS